MNRSTNLAARQSGPAVAACEWPPPAQALRRQRLAAVPRRRLARQSADPVRVVVVDQHLRPSAVPAVPPRRSSAPSLIGCTALPPTWREGPARAAARKSDSSNNAPASRTIESRAYGFTAVRKRPIATIVIVKIF
uniref:Uncharacterized protein n=1 Tax=Anopheles maculatus TaxID=74869 RepID=A0A182SMC2_9DIPT